MSEKSEPQAAAGVQQAQAPAAFYRFRRAAAVLDEFQELERQSIYFAAHEELNDPMEGYRDVFWRGDAIVWRNLFRHFILIVLLTTSRDLMGATPDITSLRKLVLCTPDDLPAAPVRQIYKDICDRFFETPGVIAVVERLSACNQPIRRDALAHILRGLNPLVLHLILNQPTFSRGLSPSLAKVDFSEPLTRLARAIEGLDVLTTDQQGPTDDFLADMELAVDQHQIRLELARPEGTPSAPLHLLPCFATQYAKALDELIYFPGYVACFSANATNASMWGTYGDAHKGVCLKFRPNPDSAGNPALDLNAVRGWRGGTGEQMEPIRGWAPHAFNEVTYTNAFPEIDFFRSIGRISVQAINRFWFRGEDGSATPIRDQTHGEEAAWRDEYWATFAAANRCKTSDWAHEQEYRIGLHSMLGGYEEKPSRVLQYRFSSLGGVVFGVNTTEADKVHIVRIVREKCKSEGRTEFEFYQTRYSRRQQKFRLVPLGSLL